MIMVQSELWCLNFIDMVFNDSIGIAMQDH